METVKFYLNCRANLNQVRRKNGLPLIVPDLKLRECLRCEKHFKSFSRCNRICDACSYSKGDDALFNSKGRKK